MPKRVERTRCMGRWTEARFSQFIKSALRKASTMWAPMQAVKKKARVSRGKYMCEGYKRKPHIVPVTLPKMPGQKKRKQNIFVDHIDPVIDPAVGFTSWDDVIERMFVEEDRLQLLCHDCHSCKTRDERNQATKRRRREKT